MRNLDLIMTLIASSLLLSLGAPWWTLSIIGVAFGFYSKRSLRQTVAQSLLIGATWFALAMIQDMRADFRISSRLAGVFQLPSPLLVYVMILLIVGLVSATSAALGATARR